MADFTDSGKGELEIDEGLSYDGDQTAGRNESKLSCEDEVGSSGAEGQNRTVDTGIFSAVLYQLSYLGG